MKRLHWLGLLVVTAVAVVSFAADIQVACEPGLRVYLDGTLVGISSANQDGLFLAHVPEGEHTVRVEKDGFAPQSFRVEARTLPIEVKVGAFSPEPLHLEDRPAGSAEAKPPVGNLRVTSAPQNCVVEVDGKTEAKDTPVLLIEGLTAGEHSIAFSKPGYERVSGVVRVRPGAEVTVRGDLVARKVETIYEGMGSLRVISTPEHCMVRILGRTREKIHPRLNMSRIPAGEHPMVVSWKAGTLSLNVVIIDGYRTIVNVSLLKGDVPYVVSYERE